MKPTYSFCSVQSINPMLKRVTEYLMSLLLSILFPKCHLQHIQKFNSISTCEESKTAIEKQNPFLKYRSKSNLADIKIRVPKFPVLQSSLFFEFGSDGCAPPCSSTEWGWCGTASEDMAREGTASEEMAREWTGVVAGKSRDCGDGDHGFTSKPLPLSLLSSLNPPLNLSAVKAHKYIWY